MSAALTTTLNILRGNPARMELFECAIEALHAQPEILEDSAAWAALHARIYRRYAALGEVDAEVEQFVSVAMAAARELVKTDG